MDERTPRSAPKILITRLSHIGDCVLTLPLLNALRDEYPSAWIAWAVESPSHLLLERHPGIDQIIKVPRGWMKSPKQWYQMRKTLRAFRFDIAIDPQGISKSSVLGWLSGAKLRIGASGRWGRELSAYLNNCLVEPSRTHLVDRSLELLQALNFEAPKVPRFALPICQQSLLKMQSFVHSQSLSPRFVVINPGASWPSKRWETERFAVVAQHVFERHGLRSVVTWAGAEEQELARQIVSVAPRASLLAPPTSLSELAALSRLAAAFIGCDTGPLHIAAGVGTPCCGLYGSTRPEESGAYGPQHLAIQKWYQSGSCRERRGAENLAMRDISATDVCQAFDVWAASWKNSIPKTG